MTRNLLDDDGSDGDLDVAVGRIERSLDRRLNALAGDIVRVNERIKNMRSIAIHRGQTSVLHPERVDYNGVPNRIFNDLETRRYVSNAFREQWEKGGPIRICNVFDPTLEEKGGVLEGEGGGSDVISVLENTGQFYGECGTIPLPTKSWKQDRQTSEPQTYYGTPRVAPTESEIEFGDIKWDAVELLCYFDIPTALLEDASADVSDFATSQMIRAVVKERDRAGVNGAGLPTDGGITGIMNTPHVNVLTMGAGDVDFANLAYGDTIDLETSPVDTGADQKYLAHRTIFGVLRKLVDTHGQPIWQESTRAGEPTTLNGYPVVRVNAYPKLSASAVSTPFLTFGDHRMGCKYGVRQDVTVLRSRDYKFAERMTSHLAIYRFDFHQIPGSISGENPVARLRTAAA